MSAPVIPPTYNPEIAHIEDDAGNIFQVLLPDGSDWDEAATQAVYAAFLTAEGLPE